MIGVVLGELGIGLAAGDDGISVVNGQLGAGVVQSAVDEVASLDVGEDLPDLSDLLQLPHGQRVEGADGDPLQLLLRERGRRILLALVLGAGNALHHFVSGVAAEGGHDDPRVAACLQDVADLGDQHLGLAAAWAGAAEDGFLCHYGSVLCPIECVRHDSCIGIRRWRPPECPCRSERLRGPASVRTHDAGAFPRAGG